MSTKQNVIKKEKGITLIALIITIIVLLILAGITISVLSGDNGIITRAKEAKEATERATWEERIDLAILSTVANKVNPTIDDIIQELIDEDIISEEGQVDKETGAITTNEPSYVIEGKLDDYVEPPVDENAIVVEYALSAGDTVNLVVVGTNLTIDWGDGNVSTGITVDMDTGSPTSHAYANGGTYDIVVSGACDAIGGMSSKNMSTNGNLKEIKVKQWGNTGLKMIMFSECDILTEMAEPSEESFKNLEQVTFAGSSIKSIPNNMFKNCTKIRSFEYTFEGCTNLETIGDYAFANCTSATSFQGTFGNCENLITIGENIFDGCDSVEYYRNTFYNCTNLQGKAPELWLAGTNSEENDYMGNPDGGHCFSSCYKLENYDEIPEYWKEEEES